VHGDIVNGVFLCAIRKHAILKPDKRLTLAAGGRPAGKGNDTVEKKTIRSGAPFVCLGAAVLLAALVLGLGSVFSYIVAAALGAAGFIAGRRLFPDRVIEVERAPQSGSAEVDALICEARAQLDEIAAVNDAIAEDALSSQIFDIESTCRLILARLEEQPGMLSSLRTFLRYYLPVTLKLLTERAKLEGEVNAGQNAEIAQKIREAMGQVQTALHRQLQALDEFRFINLESEMDVLSDMLRSDGLIAQEEAVQEAPKQEEEDPFAGLFAR